MRTVKEISAITGISVRTLHYYDEIGLLRPTEKSEAGYRLCDEAAFADEGGRGHDALPGPVLPQRAGGPGDRPEIRPGRFSILRPGHRGILPEIKQDCSSFVHLKFAESMQDFATI